MSPDGDRSKASLAWRALAGHLWFGGWFFVALPAAVIIWTGGSVLPAGGVLAWLGIAGFVATQIAVFLQIAAFVERGRGTQMPFDPPRDLVHAGIYARTRNPMYATYVLAILCESMAYQSWPLLVYACVFAIAAHFYVVLVEERSLRGRFGADYDEYCAHTGRWWPARRS